MPPGSTPSEAVRVTRLPATTTAALNRSFSGGTQLRRPRPLRRPTLLSRNSPVPTRPAARHCQQIGADPGQRRPGRVRNELFRFAARRVTSRRRPQRPQLSKIMYLRRKDWSAPALPVTRTATPCRQAERPPGCCLLGRVALLPCRRPPPLKTACSVSRLSVLADSRGPGWRVRPVDRRSPRDRALLV